MTVVLACGGAIAGVRRVAAARESIALTCRDKGTSGTQIAVTSGDLHRSPQQGAFSLAIGGSRWRWYFDIGRGPPGLVMHGNADTLDAAKAGVERIWAMWLDAAGLKDEP